MTLLNKILLSLLALVVAFGFGRYSVNPPAVTTKKTDQTEIKVDTHKEEHVVTRTVTTKAPNGEARTETITESTTVTDKDKDTVHSRTDSTVSTPQVRKTLNISALVALDPNNYYHHTYGASVTKEVAGPITVGVWALHTGIFGVSLGMNF